MSTAERLLQQGRELGMQQGIQQGREQGRELGVSEGLSRSLRQLLQLKFTEVPEWALTRLANGQVGDLERWTARVLTSDTIDEIFAD